MYIIIAKITMCMATVVITIDDYELVAVCQLTYLGSTITDNLSMDAEIDKRIGKAASVLARLTVRVWTSPKLSVKITMAVYIPCVTSTLLYDRNTWTTYAKVTNADVLSRADLPSMYTLLRRRILRW